MGIAVAAVEDTAAFVVGVAFVLVVVAAAAAAAEGPLAAGLLVIEAAAVVESRHLLDPGVEEQVLHAVDWGWILASVACSYPVLLDHSELEKSVAWEPEILLGGGVAAVSHSSPGV